MKDKFYILNRIIFVFLFFLFGCKTEYLFEESISIKKFPVKTEYYVGDKIDFAGLVINKIEEDGSKVEITDYIIEPKNDTVLDEIGSKVVKITYLEYQIDFFIEVKEKTVNNLFINSLPTKVTYYVGVMPNRNLD